MRRRHVTKTLRKLNENSGTGPDSLPSRILKRCAIALSLPIVRLARLMLNSGVWPSIWRTHWVAPLHKKRSKADPGNYRGIHLSAQLSKVLERVLGFHFVSFLERTGAYGEHQFAYSKGRGHGDALLFNVCR